MPETHSEAGLQGSLKLTGMEGYGSDYFEQTYQFAEDLIRQGLAYVCELTPEQFK